MQSAIEVTRSCFQVRAIVESKQTFTLEEVEQVLAEVQQIADNADAKYAALIEEASR
jgi:hypothetical protein